MTCGVGRGTVAGKISPWRLSITCLASADSPFVSSTRSSTIWTFCWAFFGPALKAAETASSTEPAAGCACAPVFSSASLCSLRYASSTLDVSWGWPLPFPLDFPLFVPLPPGEPLLPFGFVLASFVW